MFGTTIALISGAWALREFWAARRGAAEVLAAARATREATAAVADEVVELRDPNDIEVTAAPLMEVAPGMHAAPVPQAAASDQEAPAASRIPGTGVVAPVIDAGMD